MDLETPFTPVALSDDQSVERNLRPGRLHDFVGQAQVVDNLKLAIAAARVRRESLDHVLFSGLPGLGKTTLSYLIAAEMGVTMHVAAGPSLVRGKDVVGLLTRLNGGDVLFIDEIHRMAPPAEEYLYSAMEDLCVDFLIDQGPDARSYRLSLEPFTLVGATTREGLLTAPLRSRFGIVEKLEPYPPADMERIIHRSARLLGCDIARQAATLLAGRCRGTPRYANRFLRRIRDVAQSRSGHRPGARRLQISTADVEEGLERLGVDDHGLDRMDRRILEVLVASRDRPVGIKTLSVHIGEEESTVEEVYEPHLIRMGLVVKTPRGRLATPKAYELYGRGVSIV